MRTTLISRTKGIGLLLLMAMVGCEDDDDHFFFTDAAVAVETFPRNTVVESQRTKIAGLEVTALSNEVTIHNFRIRVSERVFGGFMATEEGITGISNFNNGPFIQDPRNVPHLRTEGHFHIVPKRPDFNRILFIENVQEKKDLSFHLNTQGLDGELITARIEAFDVSSARSGFHTVGTPGLDFTVLVSAPPRILVEAIRPQRRHSARTTQEVLAEVALTELTDEHASTLEFVEVELGSLYLGLTMDLFDQNGNLLAQGIRNPDNRREILFDAGINSVLSLAPGGSRRIFIVGDVTQIPGVDTITLEVESLTFENDNGQVQDIPGPIDATTGNLVQFTNAF